MQRAHIERSDTPADIKASARERHPCHLSAYLGLTQERERREWKPGSLVGSPCAYSQPTLTQGLTVALAPVNKHMATTDKRSPTSHRPSALPSHGEIMKPFSGNVIETTIPVARDPCSCDFSLQNSLEPRSHANPGWTTGRTVAEEGHLWELPFFLRRMIPPF